MIMNGSIDLSENRNANAIGPHYVATEIGKAVNSVGMRAMMQAPVASEEVAELADQLESIANTFGVDELRDPIAELRDLIEKDK